MFTESKIAQMGAFFIHKEGGVMPHLKLMKLLYLTDRRSMTEWGYPVSYDQMVSMPHGPVLSCTLSYINGDVKDSDYWDSWISDKENHTVSLNTPLNNLNQLDQLSDIELSIMEKTWSKFGSMDKWEIRDYTHDHCKEWKDPNNSSYPIPYKDVFKAIGRNKKDSSRLQQEIEATQNMDELFASL